MKTIKKAMPLAVAAALTGFSAGANASAFALSEQNASGLGNAYAGAAAVAEDASTIYWNPAGMTRIPGRQGVGALNAIRPKTEFTNTNTGVLTAPFQPSVGGNGGDAGDWALVPNAYLSWQINNQWFVGVGLNAPFGLKTEYDAGWIGRFHALESEVKTININPSVAFKLTDAVSLGFGVNWQRMEATLTNSVNYTAAAVGAICPTLAAACVGAVTGAGPALPGVPVVPAGTEGVATIEADDDSWGWNVGALFNLGPATRIGIAYRSSVEHDLGGTTRFANRPAALAAGLPDGALTATVELPASASWSIFHQLNPKWDLMADISWTDWSSLEALNIFRTNGTLLTRTPLNWKDSWRFGAGANYHHSSQWTFRFGTAYDETPVQDYDRTPRLPDESRVWLAFGAQYRMSKQAVLDFGYAHLFIPDKASINLCHPAQAAAEPVACRGKNNLVGHSEGNVNILSAQFRYSF
jgi:long-chain fatty acid transport protein